MQFDRLRYEILLMGKRVILTPMLVMVGFALLAWLLHSLHTGPARALSAALELILPLAAGIVVATITSQDMAIELQLTMPKKYHATAMGRLFLILAWSACIALLSSSIVFALKLDFLPQPVSTPSWSAGFLFINGLLVWLAPLCWFVGVGLCLGLLTRSRTASAALLSGVWLIEIMFKDYIAMTGWLHPVFLFPTTLVPLAGRISEVYFNLWLTSRLEVIATGMVLLPLGWLLLHYPEGLLKGSSEE